MSVGGAVNRYQLHPSSLQPTKPAFLSLPLYGLFNHSRKCRAHWDHSQCTLLFPLSFKNPPRCRSQVRVLGTLKGQWRQWQHGVQQYWADSGGLNGFSQPWVDCSALRDHDLDGSRNRSSCIQVATCTVVTKMSRTLPVEVKILDNRVAVLAAMC